MAAPSGTVWGSTVGSYGRIGIYTKVTNSSNTQSSVYVSVWFWSKYAVSDSSNQYYYNNNATSATTLVGSKSIKTTVSSGSGWSSSNQVMLADTTYTINRGTSRTKYNLAAKLSGIDRVGGTMTVTSSYTVPAKPSYKISYNANGGTGAPGTQTKYYGTNITLSSTKPTRTGYTFQGWGTTASDTSVNYAAGASYTSNASITLYAIWKANTYKVTYDANGGTGAPGTQTKTYGKTLVLSSTKPTRTNYNFVGWGTSSKDTAAKYNPGSNYTSNASITLYAIWKVAYIKPRITNFKVTRCTSNGTITDDGTYAKVTCQWATDKTVSSVKVDWKLSTASTYGTATNVTASGTSGSVSVVIGGGTLNTENAYNIRITVTDASGNNNSVLSLPPMKYIIDFLKGGTGIAFGKPATKVNTVDSAWPILSTHTDLGFKHERCDTGNSVFFGVGHGGNNRGIFDGTNDEWIFCKDIDGDVYITSDRDLFLSAPLQGVSKRKFGENKILWSGQHYMTEHHTATFSEAISAQPNGAVFIWSHYTPSSSTVDDYNFELFFVPKFYVKKHGGSGVFMNDAIFGVRKYLYVADTKATGHKTNNVKRTFNGIACDNSLSVLRYVIGI